jgi:hypothetical protein
MQSNGHWKMEPSKFVPKDRGKVASVQTIKAYAGVLVSLRPFLTPTINAAEWSAQCLSVFDAEKDAGTR